MRTEYEIFIRLCYDKVFLEEFLSDRASSIKKHYPEIDPSLFISPRATFYGIEEEYYKRLATLLKTSKEIFCECHNLLMALYGNPFFEKILLNFFNDKIKKRVTNYQQEILDPFDGYVIGPFIMNAAQKWHNEESWWVSPLLQYKWGYFHAKRVTLGFPPLFRIPNLSEGCTLIIADYELKLLLREVERMEGYSVSYEVLKKRIRPKPGYFACLIFPDNDRVTEAKLNDQAVAKLTEVTNAKSIDAIKDKESLKKLSFVISNSFLCCSTEFCNTSVLEEELAKQIRILPH